MFMLVLYAGIVHVQCYRGWYVETGYVNRLREHNSQIKVHEQNYWEIT